MDKILLTIDGLSIESEKGKSILEAALDNGIYIPHLCHHPDLEPVGVCRLCGVDLDGRGTVMSCNTPAQHGMVVQTETAEINHSRRLTMELLLANHIGDCLSCAKNNQCELQRTAVFIGVDEKRLEQLRRPTALTPIDASNPFFDFDANKCILCGICIRTCEDIQGANAIDFVNRGYETTVGTFGNKPWVESTCESCGECVVRCPVGSLIPKRSQVPAREVQSICVYCGVGCNIHLGVRGNEVVNVRADRDNQINKGSLCVKGRFGFEFINHKDRLTMPLIKRNGTFEESSWDEALNLVAKKFSKTKGEEFASLASAKCTNEENYLIQKFTRAVMGTNNVDHCARL
jgi:formate dehydrogenase major subunit